MGREKRQDLFLRRQEENVREQLEEDSQHVTIHTVDTNANSLPQMNSADLLRGPSLLPPHTLCPSMLLPLFSSHSSPLKPLLSPSYTKSFFITQHKENHSVRRRLADSKEAAGSVLIYWGLAGRQRWRE
ncbi:hypothetical protein WMY93_004624 [Mugilogobius chulae]|uniref:Uncharacterized protein n=1 Tax=Mugilogobius chulae TaxID=88201 RepID=A0AAW0PRT2_9GOBI